jgi:HEPN domain-containing protein
MKLLSSFPLPSEVYGFHVQQAVEKLFKVLITLHGEEFEFTRDFENLVSELSRLNEIPAPMALTFKDLSSFGVLIRYDDGPELDPVVRDALRQQVADLRTYVERRRLELKAVGVLVKNP